MQLWTGCGGNHHILRSFFILDLPVEGLKWYSALLIQRCCSIGKVSCQALGRAIFCEKGRCKRKMVLLNSCVGLSSTRSRTPLYVFVSVERSVDTAAEARSAFHLNNPSSKYAFSSSGSEKQELV